MRTMHLLAAFFTALAPALFAPAMAQQQQDKDAPGRVGRIAHIEGTVSVYQDSEAGWEKGYVNSPFTSENSVWTDLESRAELRVAGTAIRLDQTTQIDVVRLDDNELETFIPRGTLAVRVRHYDKGDSLQFDTPYARFTLRANGRYRIDVDPDRQEARVTAFVGEAQVGAESGRVLARAGDTVRVFGGDSPSYVVERALADPFDKWAQSRDNGWSETTTVRYVSPDMTGYEDLERNGSWAEEPDYGALWYPSGVAATWAPYRYGHWGYVRPWGWTWIDDSSWGYAPFHYGRWVYVRNRWAWTPGARAPRPVWAPALVAWVGGASFSVGAAGSSVGWYPLSPWDRYQPWYRASNTYVTRVNVVVINNAPRGQHAEWREFTRDRGATVVNRDIIIDRRPVQAAMVQVKPEVIRQAQVTTPAVVLPPRQEVMERRVASARLAAERPAAGSQRPQLPPPQPKPQFVRTNVVATQTPQPARVAPPPAQRVSPPPTREAQQQTQQRPATTTAPPPAARTAPPPATREAPPPPAARTTPPPVTREAPPAPAREAPPPAARTAPPPVAREAPPAPAREAPPPAARTTPPPVTREAPPAPAREPQAPAARTAPPAAPREAPPAPARESQQRIDEQRAAQAAQERARQQQLQQQQQQQQARQPQAQPAEKPQPPARAPQPPPQQQQQQQQAREAQVKAQQEKAAADKEAKEKKEKEAKEKEEAAKKGR